MEAHADTQHSEEARLGWKRSARIQGLVCLVCGEPPELQHRDVFFDSGLCIACAAELAAEEAPALRP